mmetsp:Transcript_25433/g.58578  ORF Transcript_25433/g.58578 Transcript_25433/m.58578 type:complete len:80 (-) Transcript_25433:2663-2902(-)
MQSLQSSFHLGEGIVVVSLVQTRLVGAYPLEVARGRPCSMRLYHRAGAVVHLFGCQRVQGQAALVTACFDWLAPDPEHH